MDNFNPELLQAIIDGIEYTGAPPEAVDQLRELVRMEAIREKIRKAREKRRELLDGEEYGVVTFVELANQMMIAIGSGEAQEQLDEHMVQRARDASRTSRDGGG